MRIAYLINQYPMVSHVLIRREILALERRGVEVMQISLRAWNSELVDPEDPARARAHALRPTRWCVGAAAGPDAHAAHAAGASAAGGAGVDHGAPRGTAAARSLVYLAEACRIELAAGPDVIEEACDLVSIQVAQLERGEPPPWRCATNSNKSFSRTGRRAPCARLRRIVGAQLGADFTLGQATCGTAAA